MRAWNGASVLLVVMLAAPAALGTGGPFGVPLSPALKSGASLAEAARAALAIQDAQALAAGLPARDPLPDAAAGDARAMDALLVRHPPGARSAGGVLEAVASLPPPQRAALDAVMAAFLGFEDGASVAFPVVKDAMPERGALAAVLDARAGLLLAAVRLHEALPEPVPGGLVVDACPAFALDLAGVSNTYPIDCVLIIDLGGDDLYPNNAGGTGRGPLPSPGLGLIGWPFNGFPAAAVLDFAGDDIYGDPENVRTGVMGGGAYGAGILLDAAGDDSYGRMSFAEVSVGEHQVCVLSHGGNVRCAAQSVLASAAELAPYDGGDAVGLDAGSEVTCVLKRSGDADCRSWDERDETLDYLAGDAAQVRVGRYHRCVLTTGGDVHCTGISKFGADPYGGAIPDYQEGDAVGLDMSEDHLCILLASGNALCAGSNRYGQSEPYLGGDATQVDVGMDVTCVRTSQGNAACHGRANFTDDGGDVVQVATGGYDYVCVRTTAGDVRCSDGSYTWGDARALDVGFFLDAPCVITGFGTMDCFSRIRDYARPDLAPQFGAGGGAAYGVGLLLDAGGNDIHVAGREGTNGGVYRSGLGLLVDSAGDDHYRADIDGGNGGAADAPIDCVPIFDPKPFSHCEPVPGPKVAILSDGGGHDLYEDRVSDCWDCTRAPKGTLGAQLDMQG